MLLETPWTKPQRDECVWYHTMRFPGGDTVVGSWDIEDFAGYVGGYDLRGKTVLDVGAASGYVSFNAEMAGARVTALDARDAVEFRQVPFSSALSYNELRKFRALWDQHNLVPLKKSWWYGWHAFGSEAKCSYTTQTDLYLTDRRFDVVIAGAIVEHLSDPIHSIGAWAKVAKEAVLIPFTDIVLTEDLVMAPMTEWSDPAFNYAWWKLSAGLYRRVFANLGFDFNYVMSAAKLDGTIGHRPTIVARRVA